jgi:hypothetical protein
VKRWNWRKEWNYSRASVCIVAKKKLRLSPLPGYPVKKPFQTMEELQTYFAQDGLPCLLCGRTYLALHLHLNKTHRMALNDYRVRYGIPWTRGLVAKPLRDKQVANMMQICQDNRIPPSSPEHMTAMLEAAKSRRPHVPATIDSLTRTALQVYRRTDKWRRKDFEEYLRRISTGRTLGEVGQDPDMPCRETFKKYRQTHPEFEKQVNRIWEGLPFAVQLRGQNTGARFTRMMVQLRRQNLSWREIGCRMEVAPKTLQKIWLRLKHQG